MRGNELLDKMELMDFAYVEAAKAMPQKESGVRAEVSKKKSTTLLKWIAATACLCIIIGAATMLPRFVKNQTDPQLGKIALSDRTTAKVSYGCEEAPSAQYKLLDLAEVELFNREEMYAFRGTVSELTNITIDFNGSKDYRCIATVLIDKVYKGDIIADEEISMLLPCPIDVEEIRIEDMETISHLKVGTEGIFMPWVYDDESYMEMNGAKLMMLDLAPCGLADGVRWAFLSTDRGLVFEKYFYPGAKDATTLDEIEAYVIEMLN